MLNVIYYNKLCIALACCSVWHRTTTVYLVRLMCITSCKISWVFTVNYMISSTVMWACCNVNIQHFVTNHTESQISQERIAALPSPFTGGWLHMCSLKKCITHSYPVNLFSSTSVLFSCIPLALSHIYIYIIHEWWQVQCFIIINLALLIAALQHTMMA